MAGAWETAATVSGQWQGELAINVWVIETTPSVFFGGESPRQYEEGGWPQSVLPQSAFCSRETYVAGERTERQRSS